MLVTTYDLDKNLNQVIITKQNTQKKWEKIKERYDNMFRSLFKK